MFQLLDIILGPVDPHRLRPRIREIDTITQPTDTVDSIANPQDVADSIGGQCDVNDTLQSAINFLGDYGNSGNNHTLLWIIAAVLVALLLCFYFVRLYRYSQQK